MTHTCNPEPGQSLSDNQQKTGHDVALDKSQNYDDCSL